MLTIDHIVIFVQDLNAAIENFRAIGFTTNYGGKHADGITENGLVIFADGTYLELIALVEGHSYEDATFRGLLLEEGEGFTGYALMSDNIQAEIMALRERGINAADVRAGSRKRPDGEELRWQMSMLDSGRIPFVIQDVTPRLLRVPAEGDNIEHPNGALGVAELKIQVTDFDAEAQRYTAIIGAEPTGDTNARFELGTSAIVLEKADAAGYELSIKTDGEAKEHVVHGAKIILT